MSPERFKATPKPLEETRLTLCQQHGQHAAGNGNQRQRHMDCVPCLIGRLDSFKDQRELPNATLLEQNAWLEARLLEAWGEIIRLEALIGKTVRGEHHPTKCRWIEAGANPEEANPPRYACGCDTAWLEGVVKP